MGRLPVWAKGKQIECAICGFWYAERSGKILKQRGMYVCKDCFDTLTDEDREKQLQRILSK